MNIDEYAFFAGYGIALGRDEAGEKRTWVVSADQLLAILDAADTAPFVDREGALRLRHMGAVGTITAFLERAGWSEDWDDMADWLTAAHVHGRDVAGVPPSADPRAWDDALGVGPDFPGDELLSPGPLA